MKNDIWKRPGLHPAVYNTSWWMALQKDENASNEIVKSFYKQWINNYEVQSIKYLWPIWFTLLTWYSNNYKTPHWTTLVLYFSVGNYPWRPINIVKMIEFSFLFQLVILCSKISICTYQIRNNTPSIHIFQHTFFFTFNDTETISSTEIPPADWICTIVRMSINFLTNIFLPNCISILI